MSESVSGAFIDNLTILSIVGIMEKADEPGILQWRLTLKPGEKQTIRFDFTIEHPRDMSIVGLP